jgi:DNA-directed RNA polymerase I, II, and III subunit RPABC2
VVSGDASAAATGKGKEKNTVESEKLKKVKNHERTTTPYMTKYERARVLGTRALQIRCVRDSAGDTEMGG